MKAVILAGGKGTRAKPYTDFFPKSMIPIGDRPVIAHLVDFLRSSSAVGEIIILTDLAGYGGQIRNYFRGRPGRISFVQDSGLGTGGDLLCLSPKLKGRGEFLLWFADNLCRIDVSKMLEHHVKKQGMACIATRSARREETGFAIIDDGMITEFREKPEIQMRMSECLGIYVLSAGILDVIRAKSGTRPVNLSYDILEGLSKKGQVSAYDIGAAPWIDAESPVVLARNKPTVDKIIRQMGRRSSSQSRISHPRTA